MALGTRKGTGAVTIPLKTQSRFYARVLQASSPRGLWRDGKGCSPRFHLWMVLANQALSIRNMVLEYHCS